MSTFEPPQADNIELTREHTVLKGLSPRTVEFETPCASPTSSWKKNLAQGLPLLMTGTLATGVIASPDAVDFVQQNSGDNANGSEKLDHRPGIGVRLQTALLPIAHTVLQATRSDLPATYTVRSGDSVSAIADRFGIPTPAILTLNGLGWNSVLHEGQVLKLTAEPTKKRGSSPARVAAEGYIVQYGESVSRIADRLGISTEALLRHNNMEQNTIVYAGTYLKLPGATAPTVARDSGGTFPGLAQQPTIIQASLSTTESGSAAEESTFDESATDVFDAADLPLAEKPALVTVRVAPKPATPPPAAKPTTPAPKPATTPAPATPAPAAPAATPAPAPPTSTIGQPMTGSITPLNDERRANARIIISVGRELGVPDYGIVIALATAMQESSLRNINWGDRDSLGLYQQRPSSGWGTADQIMDPAYSTRLFFGGPSNPNRGKTRGLLDIAGWQNMALTDAAQRVQISAHPQAYAKWEPSAWAWLYELT